MIECGDLIRALRCTKNENDDCHTCKYQVLHEGLHDYCDRDALENEAAEAIAVLGKAIVCITKERDAAIERTKKLFYLEYYGCCETDGNPCDGCAEKWRGRMGRSQHTIS